MQRNLVFKQFAFLTLHSIYCVLYAIIIYVMFCCVVLCFASFCIVIL